MTARPARLVDLANAALSLIVEEPIANLDEDGPSALHCRNLLPATVDALLARHPWRFALRREALQQTADPGNAAMYGFAVRYDVPSWLIGAIQAVLAFDGSVLRGGWTQNGPWIFAQESSAIVSGVESAPIERWPAYFFDLAAHVLAARLAEQPIAQNPGLAAELRTKAFGRNGEDGENGLLRIAREADGKGELSRAIPVASSMMAARFGNQGFFQNIRG